MIPRARRPLGCLFLVAVFALTAWPSVATPADTTAKAAAKRVKRCGKVHIGRSVQGIYIVRGTIRCATAKAIAKATSTGKGRAIDNNAVYYRGYYCGGRMGYYYCQNARPQNAKPKLKFLMRSCAPETPGCPRRIFV